MINCYEKCKKVQEIKNGEEGCVTWPCGKAERNGHNTRNWSGSLVICYGSLTIQTAHLNGIMKKESTLEQWQCLLIYHDIKASLKKQRNGFFLSLYNFF